MKKYLLQIIFICLVGQIIAQKKATSDKGERRLALIIGNSNYPMAKISQDNSANDAVDMSTQFKELGFVVLSYQNLNKNDFLKAINTFEEQLKNYDLVFFYYSGYGCTEEQSTYLFPTDAPYFYKPISDCISINYVLEKIKTAKKKIILIDASRNKTFNIKVQGNYENLNETENCMTIFSTWFGQTASNIHPNGRNSMFTGELLSILSQRSRQGFRMILDKVSARVKHLSSNKQSTYRVDKLYEDFYFIKNKK